MDAARHEPEWKHAKGSGRSQGRGAQGLTQNTLLNATNDKNKHSLRKRGSLANAPPAQLEGHKFHIKVKLALSCSVVLVRVRPARPQGLLTSRIELPLSRCFSNKHVK